jgi:hypothetical protein
MGTTKKKGEYEEFSNLLQQLAKVPHDAVKAKLEEEKKSKQRKRSKARGR